MLIMASLPIVAALMFQQPAAPSSNLDFEFFKARVQPIFTAKRAGNARCISCHSTGTPMRLQPLSPGSATWSDEESRKNFDVVRPRVFTGDPTKSRLLLHPLAEAAGGDPISIIDPDTNKVVGEITGIEVGHGAAVAGSKIYISNESESTLDVVDGKTLRVTNKIPLSGHPNNIAAGRDGKRVYVSIAQAPGAVDVIDTATLQRVKSIPVKGAVHNTYVTPDGKFVVAGSVAGKIITVIDAETEQPAWTVDFDLGVRPLAFERNPDGSTKRIFA